MIGGNPPNLTIIAINVAEAVLQTMACTFKTSHSASLKQHTCDYALIKILNLVLARTIFQNLACSFHEIYHPCVIGINEYA